MFVSYRILAIIGAAVIVGLFLLPDFVFFPLVGGAAFLAGLANLKSNAAWGIGLLLAGAAFGAFGVKCIRDHRREEDAEADRAEEEVRRRMGRIREDD